MTAVAALVAGVAQRETPGEASVGETATSSQSRKQTPLDRTSTDRHERAQAYSSTSPRRTAARPMRRQDRSCRDRTSSNLSHRLHLGTRRQRTERLLDVAALHEAV